MKVLISKLKRLARRLKALFPSLLPQGVSDFDSWANDILDIYQMPNNDSTKFALAVMITHLPPTQAYKPKHYFGMTLLKGASTQIAFAVMDTVKNKQKQLAEELKKKEALEVTAQQGTSDAGPVEQKTTV